MTTNQSNRTQNQSDKSNTSKPKEHPLNDPKQDPSRQKPMGNRQEDSRSKR